MTAYGQAAINTPQGRFVVEIQSLNRKHQEISVYLPPEMSRFEAEVRRQVSTQVGRGQVTVKLNATYTKEIPFKITPNLALAREIKIGCDQISKSLDLAEPSGFAMKILTSRNDILTFEETLEDNNVYQQIIHEVIGQALKQFISMKTYEGEVLAADIKTRLNHLKAWIEEIASLSMKAPEKYRDKLITKLNEFRPGIVNSDDDRLLKEILLYSEKIDISEEITRFRSHLSQLERELESKEFSIGKKLEFIMQELGREINTIGSKSSEVSIARLVVEIKSELERIREQIQNVE